MQKFFLFVVILFTSLGTYSCQNLSQKHWLQSIPGKTPAVIVPSTNLTPTQALEQEYIPFIDDITSSAIQLVSEIDSFSTVNLQLNALVLYPGVDQQLQPTWLIQAPNGFVETLHQSFYQDFTQNKYSFHDRTIYRLHVKDRVVYASQLHNQLLLSESSLGIEDAIRTYLDLMPSIAVDAEQLKTPSLIVNTPSLDHWVEQLTKVEYRPGIKDAFNGTGPVILDVEKLSSEGGKNELQFNGNVPLTQADRSELVDAFSSENAPITLDRYISGNAASFAIFRLPPRLVPPDSLENASELDSLYMSDNTRYADLARTLDPEFSLVTYTESGFLSTGEHLFLRKLNDRNGFEEQLNELVKDGLLRKPDGTFVVQGSILAKLIGSELCSYTDFYLDLTGEVAVISKRKGLAEIIQSDRTRRRVIYYDQDYMDIRSNLPEEVSSYVFANTDFYDFIQSYLDPDTYANAITSQFNQLTMSFQLNQDEQQLAFEMRTYTREQSDIPYEEQWFFPAGGAQLSGEPVLADLRGSARDEIVFATTSGSVYALASDGTTVMQTNTGDDEPVGSPVVYDWYNTDQQVILLAAGNKIYGWNESGTALPQFPFELEETITTPLTITDLDRDGLPDALVATADRQLHALNGRGNNMSGWPVMTNAVINEKPVVNNFQGSIGVIAFSENAIHAWNEDGSPKNDFPKFINASLNGSPLLHNSSILGGAADGYLYAVGGEPMFPDSINVYSNRPESNNLEAAYVSNSALMGTPSLHSLTLQSAGQTYQGNMILTMSSNGSVFLLNEQGQLRMTKSMGQPAAQNFSPFVTDINSDGVQDIISLASFGRLYAWQVSDGERLYDLPTSGMQFPVVTDLDGDGNKELIAQTSEGLRCWTIYSEQ
ncbi:VCBS repeat-containing protein [Aliifodinibius sp. S!AR15-10]|uniref:FG-GAP repeat domain-containing protein n=1 Tax=Aliifodinibius sp. S!AR15-10 TaxID=2950437 RepID=UPI00285F2AB6|nr:VCBS repeat-containing protein [Aliifodinibius sp. S!AR15-10]MDR8393100.1 VCBS repeat-containing protein [Aliifodinibius sp. S!AR15-10]